MTVKFAREIRQLIWHSNDREGDLRGSVRSGQSQFEAEQDARFKMQRHRSFWTNDGRGRFTLPGTDLGCGCTAHRTGQKGGSKHGSPINIEAEHAVREESPIGDALNWADDLAQYVDDPPWTCRIPPSRVIELCFRTPLKPEFAMFDPAASRVYYTLKLKGSTKKLEQERLRLAATAAESKAERGYGNLAPYTGAAQDEFGFLPEHEIVAETLALATRLMRLPATAHDRYLQREITAENERLQLHALGLYKRSHTRLPGALPK